MAVILIVEDDAFIRKCAASMIKEWGHETYSAGEVEEALMLLGTPQHFDALFTDIRLKTAVHGGYDIARRAIQFRPQLRVLYTTGDRISDANRSLFVRGAQFLPKPYTEARLKRSVSELLASA